MRIGQPQVQQDNVKMMFRQVLLGIAHALHMRQLDNLGGLPLEHLAEQMGVAGVIFDQKYFDRFVAHPRCLRKHQVGKGTAIPRVTRKAVRGQPVATAVFWKGTQS